MTKRARSSAEGSTAIGRVLVLDGDTRSALSIVRSLGRGGVTVSVAASRRDAIGFASRYANEVFLVPSPMESPDEYADAIVERVEARDVAVVLPCSGASIQALQRARRRLRGLTVLAMASDRTIRRMSDKVELFNLAASLDIPTPVAVTATTPLRAPEVPFRFPVFVRPRRSVAENKSGFVRVKVAEAQNLDRLSYILRYMPPEVFPALVQSRLTGERETYHAVCRRGKPIVEFSQKPIRDLPWLGGASVLREAAPVDPEVGELSRRLVAALRVDGPVFVEYMRERPGGRPCLLKAKPHFWRSLQIGVDAGIDFPRLALDVALGGEPKAPARVVYGLRSRWLLGDLEYLIMYLWKGRRIWSLPGRAPSRLEVLARYLQDGKDPATRPEVESEDDPGPSMVMRRRFRLKWLQVVRHALLSPFGKALNRYKGVIVYEGEEDHWDRRRVKELTAGLQDIGMRFVCLAYRCSGRDAADYEKFVRWCARETTERFIVIPGQDYETHSGERILALGVKRFLPRLDAEHMIRAVRDEGGVSVWRDLRIGDMNEKSYLAEEVHGVEIWNPTRHGSLGPSSMLAQELATLMERSPYVGAFQCYSSDSIPKKPKAVLKVRAPFFSERSIESAMETGDFDLCGRLFRLRNDRVSYPIVRTYLSWLNVLSGKGGISVHSPSDESAP